MRPVAVTGWQTLSSPLWSLTKRLAVPPQVLADKGFAKHVAYDEIDKVCVI